jgi:hypothetical protein
VRGGASILRLFAKIRKMCIFAVAYIILYIFQNEDKRISAVAYITPKETLQI